MSLSRNWTTSSFCVAIAAYLGLVPCHALGADQLRVPLAAIPCPTSSFGEWRSTHLHAGVDFSTAGRIGVPVVAVDTLWVWRISVKNGGYGRALYAVLNDGEVALYAHLYRFATPMERAAEAEQNRLGVYEVDLYGEPGTFRFMPGDTIAFSGDTGAGPPHLHFELRSAQADHEKLNPLPGRFDLAERVSPVIRKVRIRPLGPVSQVNAGFDEISLNPSGPAGTPAETLAIAGPFGASVYATDVGLCERSLPPTTYEAWIDDAPVWRLQFDEFPFAKGHFVRALYHLAGSAEYVRLFDPFGLDLEGFNHYAPRSLRFFENLRPGAHNLRIKVSDVWGNYDQVSLPFTYGTLPEFEAFSLENCAAGVRVRIAGAEKACGSEVAFRRSAGAWHPVQLSGSGGERTGLIEGPASGLEVVGKLTDPSGLSSDALLAANGTAAADAASIEIVVRPGYLEICGYTQAPPSSLPVAWVSEGDYTGSCLLQPTERNVFRGCYSLRALDEAVEVRVAFQFGPRPVEKAAGLLIGLIDRGRTVRLALDRFRVRMEADKDRTFRTLVRVREEHPASYPGFERCEGRLVFEPRDAFFEKGLKIYVDSGKIRLAGRDGLFSEAAGRLSLVGAFDSTGVCRATIYTLDPLVVLEDASPPVIKWTGSLVRRRDGTGIFTASASDGGSGIDTGTIRASVDDQPAIAAYDPDTGKISVRTTKPLPYGRHRLRLEANDRLGNTAHSEIVRDLLK